ncbi:MAG: sugar ABC transporter ATP-binding protein [Clostridiales bacterium]|nr:sugar ABC transporter ATP-binding protein [Clostridiales bacterium]
MADIQYHVDMQNICKIFGGVKALQNVSIQIKSGEIHALVGENGAGKSTLMKILSGAYVRDSGDIYLDGKKVAINNPKDGIGHGISVIYQEFALIGSLTVAENIFIDKLNDKGKLINWKILREKATNVLSSLGFSNIPANKIVSELSVAHQQVVEICKALARESSVLILDEPTAVLASSEVEQLFKLLKDLRSKDVAIVYISHRLEEIFRLSDRITVMKDGCCVGTYDTPSMDEKKLVSLMIGRTLESYFPAREPNIGETVFKVENIKSGKAVRDVSFEVREGEVLGISGLVGSGRTETMRAIFGADPLEGGKIFLNGKAIKIKSPMSAVRQGIGMLPEDRKAHGVLLKMPIRTNITLTRLKAFTGPFNVISKKKETIYINDMVQKLAIKAGSVENNTNSLSGGNQQKIAIAKLLASDCKVLILDEPTRGVDVGAKIEIYKIINSLVAQKYAVIMISSEMMEVIGMCDRVMVMRSGSMVGELQKNELTEQNLINYSMGVNV